MSDAAQDAGICGDQSTAASAGAGSGRRHHHYRIDRDLPLFRNAAARPAVVRGRAKDIAIVEMWNRRAEINFFANVAAVFRHTHPAMKELEMPQVRGLGRSQQATSDLVP